MAYWSSKKFSRTAVFEISEDGKLIVEIPSARPGDKEFREQLKWDWLELGGGYKAVCERLGEHGWKFCCRMGENPARFIFAKFKP